MKLTDLSPNFMRYEERIEEITRVRVDVWGTKDLYTEADHETVLGPVGYYVSVDILAEAQGIRFGCPLCFHGQRAGYVAGMHTISIGFEGRALAKTFSRDSTGRDSRWKVMPGSTGYEDLTLTPSIHHDPTGAKAKVPRCSWHGFVTDGQIITC